MITTYGAIFDGGFNKFRRFRRYFQWNPKKSPSMLRQLITEYGLALVFANVLLETLGLPLPALPTLIVTGALLSSPGTGIDLSGFPGGILSIILVGTVAASLGDLAWFLAGRYLGNRILRNLCKISISQDTCIRRSERFFERWGMRSLTLAKFIPGLSTLALPMAGAAGISLRTYFMYDIIGVLLWVCTGVGLGALFAPQLDHLLSMLDRMGHAAMLIVAAAFVLYIALRWWRRYSLIRLLRMVRIDVMQLAALMQSDLVPVVLDVRSEQHRRLDPVMIPGTQFLSFHDIESQAHTLPTDRKLVVYCSCPNEVSAAYLTHRLNNLGFSDVSPLLGGLDAWRNAGFELEAIHFG